MEFRKLIGFGKGSFVVTLPKEWVTKNNLKKGTMLSMDISGSTLVISTSFAEERTEKKVITLNVDNKPMEEIATEIVTSYLRNCDIMELISRNIKDKDEKIKEIIMDLAGMEILEQTNTKITAKYLMDIREISLDSLIRRMDNITRSLVIDAILCIKGECNYRSIKQRDKDVNRLHFLIRRTVRAAMTSSKKLQMTGKSTWQLDEFLVLGEKLEKIADRQKRIARGLEGLQVSKSFAEQLRVVYENIYKSYIDVMKSFYQTDSKAALKIELSNKKRIEDCDYLLGEDIKKEYKLIKQDTEERLISHVHEHMIMTEIINNLKAMATSVKLIARLVLNDEA